MDDRRYQALRMRPSDQRQFIPKALLRAMAGLVLASLALTTYAVVTDRPHAAQVHTAEPVQSMLIDIKEGPNGSAIVQDMDGAVLATSSQGASGFIAVVQNALAFNRKRAGIADNPPVTLIRFADGRIGLRDDATGWKIHLTGFGRDNTRAFAQILEQG